MRNMLEMSFPRLTVDEDVIKEYKDKGLKIWLHNFIHEAMEGGRNIAKSKRHNQKIIVAFMGAKSHLRDVFLFHLDLMVSRAKIQFGEILGSMKLIQQIIYDWDRQLILDSKLIKCLKIRAHPLIVFFL